MWIYTHIQTDTHIYIYISIYILYIYGVLRKLKHIFPNTYQRIKSICLPAKVGLVVIDLITSPVVSWRGWETPLPPAPWLSCHSLHDLERRSVGWEAGHHIYPLVSIRKNVF